MFVLGLLTSACELAPESLPIRRFRPTSPAPGQAAASIGPSGGTLTLPGGASAALPAAALNREVWLVIQARGLGMLAALPEGTEALSSAHSFLPIDQRFARSVSLQLAYPEQRVGADIRVLRLDDAQDASWERVQGATTSIGVARASTRRFGIYVVVRESGTKDAGVGE